MRVAVNGKGARGPHVHHPGPLWDGMWAGQRCFVVGGGESLESFDWSTLAFGERVIAVNATSFNLNGGWLDPTIAFTMDAAWARKQLVQDGSFLPWESPGHVHPPSARWEALQSIKVFHDVTPEGWPWEFGVERAFDAHLGSSGWLRWGRSLEDGLVWSCNSGLSAINLADVLGASPIYLVGFDGHGGHFHIEYDGEPTDDYHRMAHGWHEACVDQVRGEVVNLNLGSSLLWPKGVLV